MHIFHRLRVSNIRNKVDPTELYHVEGKQNISDTGTRPDLLRPDDIVPGSEWMTGLPWMRLGIDDAMKTGVIKHVDEIKLDNEARKQFKEGVLLDSSLNFTVHSIEDDPRYVVPKKVLEREEFSNYVYPPLKRGFKSFIRIASLVLLAAKKFKVGMVRARTLRGETVSDGSTPDSLKSQPAKFSMFHVSSNSQSPSIVQMYRANLSTGVHHVLLDDRDLSRALEYVYRKTTAEFLHFNGVKLDDKIGMVHDGILLFNHVYT